MTEFLNDQFGGVLVDRLILRDHHAHVHQRFDDIGHTFGHAVGQLGNGDGFGHAHVADDLFTFRHATHGLLPLAFLLALHRGHGALPPTFATGQRFVQCQLASPPRIAFPTTVGALALVIPIRIAADGGRATGLADTTVGDACIGWLGRCNGIGRLGRIAAFGFFALTARVFLGLGLERFFMLPLFAFLGLDLGAAAGAIILAALLFLLAAFLVLDLPRLGVLQRAQATLKFGIGHTCRPLAAFGIDCSRRLGTRLGRHDPLALGLHNHTFRASTGEALVHTSRVCPTRQAKGFLSVLVAHASF